MISAFGDTMSMRAWSRDPRCKVPFSTLRWRLVNGWSNEEAIGVPVVIPHTGHTAFGETKSLPEWAEDARCGVAFRTLYWRVTSGGMSLEEAIVTPRTPDGKRR